MRTWYVLRLELLDRHDYTYVSPIGRASASGYAGYGCPYTISPVRVVVEWYWVRVDSGVGQGTPTKVG